MCRRANEREAFGSKLAEKQFVQDFVAKSRIETEQARLLTLPAAWKMDTFGKRAARREISMIKVVAANVVMDVLDRAIQVHGSLGMSDDTPLAGMWRFSRCSRSPTGPTRCTRWSSPGASSTTGRRRPRRSSGAARRDRRATAGSQRRERRARLGAPRAARFLHYREGHFLVAALLALAPPALGRDTVHCRCRSTAPRSSPHFFPAPGLVRRARADDHDRPRVGAAEEPPNRAARNDTRRATSHVGRPRAPAARAARS